MCKTWCIIKEVIGMPGHSFINKHFTINGKTIRDPQSIADHFNSYFINIGNELTSTVQPSVGSHSTFLSSSYFNSIFLSPVTNTEVCNCSLKHEDGSPGPDGLTQKS